MISINIDMSLFCKRPNGRLELKKWLSKCEFASLIRGMESLHYMYSGHRIFTPLSETDIRKKYSNIMHHRAIAILKAEEEYGFDYNNGKLSAKGKECYLCHKYETLTLDASYPSFEEYKKGKINNFNVSVLNSSFVKLEKHHISRGPEKIIYLCHECHVSVEHGRIHPEFIPEKSRSGKPRNTNQVKYCLLTNDYNFDPIRFFDTLTYFRLNVMRKDSGLRYNENCFIN